MPYADPQTRLDSLIEQWLQLRQEGLRHQADQLLQQHPELIDEMSRFRDDYEQLDRRFDPLRKLTNHTARSAAEMATLGHTDTSVPAPPAVGSTFGDYDLLTEIARGGMGVVFRARQRSLNRVVALKMVLGSDHGSSTDRTRFLAEARAVARLNHPHIVPIYEVGEQQHQPYFTMEFITGGSLRDQMEKLRGDQPAIARLMVTVARAVEHAHRRGILHRDLKPGNVLLDEQLQPHVTDFGLAKRLDEESDLTQAGVIVGTPAYMAPEQANAQTDLTTAVDVYGLGAVLYELLAGRPPFKGNSPMETMLQVMSSEPQRPRKLVAELDADLETICLKCLEKKPLDRYSSADALADDLERWLAGKPILARAVTPSERLLKWARRQPVLAGSLATIATTVLGLMILAGFLWQNAEARAQAVSDLGEAKQQLAQANGERQQVEAKKSAAEKLADEQRKLADQQKALAEKIGAEVQRLETAADAARQKLEVANHEARRTLYAADMQLAHAAWQGENITTAIDLIGRYQAGVDKNDPRGFEWHYLNRQIHGARLSWRDEPVEKNALGSIVGLAVSPDGKTLVTAQNGNNLKLWNLADGKLLRTIETPKSNTQAALSPNLTGVFFEDEGRKVTAVVRKAFDVSQIEKAVREAMNIQTKLNITSLVDALEFQSCSLADDKPMRTELFDATRVRTSVFPVMAGGFFLVDEGNMQMLNALDVSPDGKFVALAGAESKVAGGDRQHPGRISGGSLIIWNLKEGKIHARQKSPVMLTAVAFSPVGDSLAIATSDGAVGIGKVDLAQPPQVLLGHQGMVYALKFTPDGKRLASGAMDGLVLLWDVATAKETARLRGHTSPVSRIEFTPEGRTLISGGVDGSVKVWDWERTHPYTVLHGHVTAIGNLTFTGDGSELLSVDLSGNIKAWGMQDGKQLRDSQPKKLSASVVRISKSGKTMVWKEEFGDWLMVRDVPSGKETKLTWKDHLPYHLSLSSDETLLAASDLKGKGLCIWNIADGKIVARLDELQGMASALTFSSDNQLLVVAHGTGVILWDWKAATSRTILENKGAGITSVVFSADNRFIAAASVSKERIGEGMVHIWDLEADQLRAECQGAGQIVQHLAFSPDGRRLLTGGTNAAQRGMLKLWDTTSGRELFSVPLPAAMLTAVAFSPDGHRLAAALSPLDVAAMINGRNVPAGVIHVWDATPVMTASFAKAAAAQLQGTWIVTSAELNGAVAKSSEGDQFTFADGKVTIETKVKKTEPNAFRLDTTKQPPTIDIEGQDAMQAIYELKGDELTLCYATQRPTAFDSKQGLLLKLRKK